MIEEIFPAVILNYFCEFITTLPFALSLSQSPFGHCSVVLVTKT